MGSETDQEFIHNGKRIVLSKNVGAPESASSDTGQPSAATTSVTIDDEQIPVLIVPGTGEYIATEHSPYLAFDNLTDLAIHVADAVIGMRSA